MQCPYSYYPEAQTTRSINAELLFFGLFTPVLTGHVTLEPTGQIVGPKDRKLDEGSLRYHLGLIRDGQPIEPVCVYRAPCAPTATLINGMHRWRLCLALGYPMIPCHHLTQDEAAEYGLS